MAIKKAAKKATKKAKSKLAKSKSDLDKEQSTVQVQAQPDQLLGKYCNIALIHHTKLEFIFDFVFTLQNNSTLASRVITSPNHAKRLSQVLAKNIKDYEKKFGEIVVDKKA